MRYILKMIKTFQHKGLSVFHETGKKKHIIPEHALKIELILERLETAK